MSNQYSSCQHEKYLKDDTRDFDICSICGVIFNENTAGLKLSSDNFNIYLSPLDHFEEMKKTNMANNILLQRGKKTINSHYLLKRASTLASLKRLATKLKFSNKAFHMALYYTDIILINNYDLKSDLTAICCLLLAVKFEENDPYIPELTNFQLLDSVNFFYMSDITTHEIVCIKMLDYNLYQCTAFHYLKMFCGHGIVFEDEINEEQMKHVMSPNRSKEIMKTLIKPEETLQNRMFSSSKRGSGITSPRLISLRDVSSTTSLIEKCITACFDVLDVIIEDNRSLEFSQLQIALTCIAIGRHIINLSDWPLILEKVYNISIIEFKSCYDIFKSKFLAKENAHSTKSSYNKKISPLKITSANGKDCERQESRRKIPQSEEVKKKEPFKQIEKLKESEKRDSVPCQSKNILPLDINIAIQKLKNAKLSSQTQFKSAVNTYYSNDIPGLKLVNHDSTNTTMNQLSNNDRHKRAMQTHDKIRLNREEKTHKYIKDEKSQKSMIDLGKVNNKEYQANLINRMDSLRSIFKMEKSDGTNTKKRISPDKSFIILDKSVQNSYLLYNVNVAKKKKKVVTTK